MLLCTTIDDGMTLHATNSNIIQFKVIDLINIQLNWIKTHWMELIFYGIGFQIWKLKRHLSIAFKVDSKWKIYFDKMKQYKML